VNQGLEHASPIIVVLFLVLVGPVPLLVRWVRKNRDRVYVRRLAGVDALNEALGRAAEDGRPASFCMGMTGVGPVLYACLGILYSIAQKAAHFKSRVLVPQSAPESLAMVEDTLRDAYRDVGHSAQFDPSTVLFLSEDQFAYASGYMGMMHRENVGAAFLFGSFAGESLILAEAGQQIGAMQVAGSISPEQVPFFICTCDYTLIGEELFAASAYLTREPVQVGSLATQDFGKALVVGIIIIGVLVETVNQIAGVSYFSAQSFYLLGQEWWEGLWR
jgi:hypothetical protein